MYLLLDSVQIRKKKVKQTFFLFLLNGNYTRAQHSLKEIKLMIL